MTRKISLRFNDYFAGQGTGDSWSISLKACQRPVKTFHEELLANAEIIRSLSDRPIYLMYSGGLDSEYILDIFLSLKIPITPVIVKLSNYNTYDVEFANKYCQSKSINPIIIDIDFDHFVTSGKFLEIANSTCWMNASSCQDFVVLSQYKSIPISPTAKYFRFSKDTQYS
jgi:hypothetical protein